MRYFTNFAVFVLAQCPSNRVIFFGACPLVIDVETALSMGAHVARQSMTEYKADTLQLSLDSNDYYQ